MNDTIITILLWLAFAAAGVLLGAWAIAAIIEKGQKDNPQNSARAAKNWRLWGTIVALAMLVASIVLMLAM